MPAKPPGPRDTKLLTDGTAGGGAASSSGSASPVERVQATSPARQLADMPRDELDALGDEFGLDPTKFKERSDLVAALHDRRQMIASFDREAMLDVVRWGRRPVAAAATKEQLAKEVARIRSMRFAGLSARGLVVLARMRGVRCADDDEVPDLVKKLKKTEGMFARWNRKRRSFIAGVVANMIGEADAQADYKYLPGPDGRGGGGGGTGGADASLKHEIEEAGLFGGISNRLKKTADSYLNQKLDEIEARIDRKLDEIDRRLAEWRDKEVANRIKILKITLWASVIVGIVSLVYSYVTTVLYPTSRAGAVVQQRQAVVQPAPAPVPTPQPATVPATVPATQPS